MTEKQQFNYKKLTNEGSVKVKPKRPPDPKVNTAQNGLKEGLLIDISPENMAVPMTAPMNKSNIPSIIDEPIDVPEGF